MPKITGADKVTLKLSGLSQEAVELVGSALHEGGSMIASEAQHLITEGSVSGRHHVPSLPGDPPMNDTGVLRSHIEVTQPEPLKVEISSNAPYSAALEFGTSKMLARPFMAPAARSKKKEVVALVRKAVSGALKG